MKTKYILLQIVVLSLLCSAALAATPMVVATVSNINFSAANDVTVSTTNAYHVQSKSVKILNINDPNNPTFVSEVPLSDGCGAAISGDYLYVADGNSGLEIINVADSSNPYSVTNLDNGIWSLGIDVLSNYVYLIGTKLSVIDVSNPALPSLAGDLDVSLSSNVKVVGNHAFASGKGLEIIDISNPASMTIVGSWSALYTLGLDVDGNYAYLADYNYGLKIVDISNPLSPLLVGTYSFAGDKPIDVSVSGPYAYVVDSDGDTRVIDVSVPATPSLLTTIPSVDSGKSVCIQGNFVFLATHGKDKGLDILNITTPASPVLVGSCIVNTPLNLENIHIAGDYAYGASWDLQSLLIFDVTTEYKPRFCSAFTTGEAVWDVASSGDYAYVVGGSKLYVIDVSNAESPWLRNTVSLTDSFEHLKIVGSYLYAEYNSGLAIYDITDPINPGLLGEVDVGMRSVDGGAEFRIVGNYAYLTLWSTGGFAIIDISNPAAPTLKGTENTLGLVTSADHTDSVQVVGDYVYYWPMWPSPASRIADITTPTNPIYVTNFEGVVGSCRDAEYMGSNLCVSSWSGFTVLDVSNPLAPTKIAQNVDISAGNFEVDGNYSFLANSAGLCVIMNDPTIDSDNDTQSDYNEVIAGTNPTNPTSIFRLTNHVAQAGVGNILNWPSATSRTYSVYYATNLLEQPEPFFVLASNLVAFPPENAYTDTIHHAESQVFYLIEVEKQ